MGLEDEQINDLGEGLPLYAAFEIEDWMLLSIRFELHLLIHAFIKDANDSERTGFPESQLAFYYGKYFKKTLSTKVFGVTGTSGLVSHIKDTISLEKSTQFLEARLPADTSMQHFIKQTELARRVRERRLNVGDETAALNFVKAQLIQPTLGMGQEQHGPSQTPGTNVAVQGQTIRPKKVLVMGRGNKHVAKVLQPAMPGMVRPTFQSAGPMQAMNRPQILPPNLGISIAANASVQAGTGPKGQSVAVSSKLVPAPRSDINPAGKGSHQPSVVKPRAEVRPRKWGGRMVP